MSLILKLSIVKRDFFNGKNREGIDKPKKEYPKVDTLNDQINKMPLNLVLVLRFLLVVELLVE